MTPQPPPGIRAEIEKLLYEFDPGGYVEEIDLAKWEALIERECSKAYQRGYRRTFDGLVNRMYGGMRARITHGKTLCSKEDFVVLARTSNDLRLLYEKWEENGFIRSLTPSVDRIDASRGYEVSNIQFCTTEENSLKNMAVDYSVDRNPDRTSKFRGVTYNPREDKWKASVQKHLGTFTTELEAAAAYEEASQKLNGVPSCNRYPLLEDAKKAAAEQVVQRYLGAMKVLEGEDSFQFKVDKAYFDSLLSDLYPAPHADQ